MAEQIFPRSHNAWPLVSFYGDGEQWLGQSLLDFFNTVPLTGPRTELCRIMTEEMSDKGSGWHNYTLLYDFLFRPYRYRITRMFEVGLGTNFTDTPSNMGERASPGASLRGWRRYFPRAHILGADIDTRILFFKEKISTFHVDQLSDGAIDVLWQQLSNDRFDIMIDDGLHTFEANTKFFLKSLSKLKCNGYYVIEDIVTHPDNLQRYHAFFSSWGASGVIVKIPNHLNDYDNCLGIFRNTPLVERGDVGRRTKVGAPALNAYESATGDPEEAVVAYRAALEGYTRDRTPAAWAHTQNSLGNALMMLGTRESGTAQLEDAVLAYRAALEGYTRDRTPAAWAHTQNNLGNALMMLGTRESGTAQLQEAVAAFDAALQVFIALGADHYVSVCRENRDTVSELLAKSGEGERACGPQD
jgi:tetratricopeptide (TPR) repeat protein